MMQPGNTREESCNDCSDHGGAGATVARRTRSLRYGTDRVRFASPRFVAIVEIEENFAHVAAMAGMASGDVGAGDSCGHFGAQVVDELRDKFSLG